jgi:tight adherence protein C
VEFESLALSITVFVIVTGGALLLTRRLWSSDPRIEGRLEGLNGSASNGELRKPGRRAVTSRVVQKTLPKVIASLLPNDQDQRKQLQSRLMYAGIYAPSAPGVFQLVKATISIVPVLIGLVVGLCEWWPMSRALFAGSIAGGFGMILPSVWLDRRKARRHLILNRSLPDALDLMVTCVEAGLSLEASLKRVTEELRIAHPTLAGEMGVMQKQIEFGAPPDEAIANSAERTDLESLATLGSLIQQARRFGTGIADALRTHAEMLRTQREQVVEELAQKASVKILFPTLLFIFPATFVVLAAPAAIQLQGMFAQKAQATAKPSR